MRFVRRADLRSRAAARAALPDTIEIVIIGVRAGLTPAAAFTMAAEHAEAALAPALAEAVQHMHRGRRLADALGALPDWLGPAADSFTDALTTADRYGLPIEPVLDRLTIDVRTERSHHAQEQARTLPVKLAFPLVVCTLPSFVLLAIVPAVLGALSTLRGGAL
ncbi:MAG: type II secretion system F family protein [Ilumatobacteraceae bacterium]